MATIVNFIDETYIKKRLSVSESLDIKLLKSSIFDAQNIHIQDAIGTNLYEKINTLLINEEMSDAGNEYYKTLFDNYIKISTLYWMMTESIIFTHYKFTNKGIQVQSAEESAPVETNELKYIMSTIKDKAEFYTDRMKKYICANISSFPEYSSNTEIDEVRPNENPFYTSDIYLENTQYDYPSRKYYDNF